MRSISRVEKGAQEMTLGLVSLSRLRPLAMIVTAASFILYAGPLWGQWTGGPSGPIAYTGGSVGIGTANPAELLEVSGASEPLIRVTHTGMPGSPYLEIGMNAGNNGALFQATSGKDFKFYNGQYALTMLGSNGNVSIGTTDPPFRLTVAPGGEGSGLAIGWNRSVWQGETNFYNYGQGGVGGFSFWNYSAPGATYATTSGPTNLLTILSSGNVGIGTTNPQNTLSVNGIIQAKEVLVNTGWSDYVFAADYKLRSLNEVAVYIRENHHLPEIPSAKEVEEKGVSLGEMQSKLLAKIEELTLHMIQAEERNNRLEQQNREFQERIERLESRSEDSATKRNRAEDEKPKQ